jgi:hypothetical protein
MRGEGQAALDAGMELAHVDWRRHARICCTGAS